MAATLGFRDVLSGGGAAILNDPQGGEATGGEPRWHAATARTSSRRSPAALT